jgi:hypothetical protein
MLHITKLWVRTLFMGRCDQACQWLATGQWFSLVSSTNKTDCHDITEILLKVALNTINQTKPVYLSYTIVWQFKFL